MIELTCQTCNEKFLCYPSQNKNNRRKYCSNACRFIGASKTRTGKKRGSKRTPRKCPVCEIAFIPKKKEQIYCCIKCANVLNPKNIKRGRKQKTYSRKRTDKWAMVLTRCDFCNKLIEIQKWKMNRTKRHFCQDNNKACYRAWLKENRRGKNHPCFGKKPSTKSGRGIGGIYNDIGHYVRSTWEANIARWLIKNGIEYMYEPKTFIFEEFSYTPDFYTPHNNQYIEVKGWWSKGDKIKVERFLKDGHNLWIIDKNEYIRLGFNPNETRYNSIRPVSANS